MPNQAYWLCVTRLRDNIACDGHAMPFNPRKLRSSGGSGACDTPILVFAQGCSVPISRGSPPTLE